MSIISEKVRAAIYAKTNVLALVDIADSTKLYGIFEGKAPPNIPANRAYGIFNRLASEPVVYTFNYTTALETDFWQFRIYAASQIMAETMLNTWINTLGNTLTLTGNTVAWLARENDLPPTDQQIDDRYFYGRGASVRIATE